jgi:hypothetical protein
VYGPVFRALEEYWIQAFSLGFNASLGQEYPMCAARQLNTLLSTPEDWLRIGKYLAEATAKTYSNGSHQFIGDAIPALIDAGIVGTIDKLVASVEVLLETIIQDIMVLMEDRNIVEKTLFLRLQIV